MPKKKFISPTKLSDFLGDTKSLLEKDDETKTAKPGNGSGSNLTLVMNQIGNSVSQEKSI